MGTLHVDLIMGLFETYQERKRAKQLYSNNDSLPQSLITLYYDSQDRLDFHHIVYNFKRKYLYNENEMERVHTESERDGLSEVYDYMIDKERDICANIYVILVLHSLLYSKVPCPEFGGKIRTTSACIADSDIQSTDPNLVSSEIAKLYVEYSEILKMAETVIYNHNSVLLMQYIDRCIELKCKLIEIHPFADGNGRTMRAMLNLLFRKVELPPVYIRNKERDEYLSGMDKAVRLQDSTEIKKFYYYKICDSIIDLDIKERNKTVDNIPKSMIKTGPLN